MQNWIILGAGSDMARPFLRRLAGEGASLFLAGRNAADLEVLAQDLRLRGAASAEVVAFDARDASGYPALVARLVFPIILRSWEEFGPMGVAMTLLIWAGVIGTGWVLTACISAVLWEDSEATAEPVPGAEPG